MRPNHSMVPLGFADENVPVGTHICQIFSEDNERSHSLLNFLLSGLQIGERTACYSDNTDEEAIDKFLSSNDVSYEGRKESNAIEKVGTHDVYFQDNIFDPDRILDNLNEYYLESLDLGFPACRAIGEMMPLIENIEGGDRLLEYESRVSLLLRDSPITTVCQYNANEFNGATILDVLKVHPHMFISGAVVKNPFYIEPEEFLNIA